MKIQYPKFALVNTNLFFLQDRKTKDGQQVREKFPDNTFNYTRNLLTECGLIRIENNNYYIQESQIRFVDAIVKGELS